jgi:transposase
MNPFISDRSWCLEHVYLIERKDSIMSIAIGIDISKEKLDIYYNGKVTTIPNKKEAIKKFFYKCDKSQKIVMEATGKYHRLSHNILFKMGFSVMVINPFQSRNYARALNIICKTDKVDATVLASFGERMEFHETLPLTETEELLQGLSRHLDDLKEMKKNIVLHLQEAQGFIAKSLKKTLKTIDKEIEETEKQLKEAVAKDPQLLKNCALLMSIPGVGEPTALMLLSYLRELGQASKKEISALSGLAPMNNDSGSHNGKRRIRGGRHDVRSALYMPILGAATMHNKRLKEQYNRLVGAGKLKKVALTACMHKLVIWANAIIKSQKPWDETLMHKA